MQLRGIAPTRGGGGSNGDGKRHGGRRGGVCGTLLNADCFHAGCFVG